MLGDEGSRNGKTIHAHGHANTRTEDSGWKIVFSILHVPSSLWSRAEGCYPSQMPAPVLTSLSQRVLPVLQLTRMALVFTAIADSMCGLLLRAAQRRTLFHTRLIE